MVFEPYVNRQYILVEVNLKPGNLTNKIIGARVSEERKKRGWSQADLAEKLNYKSAAAISYLEAGLRLFKPVDLDGLSRIFNLTIDDLFKGPTSGPSSSFGSSSAVVKFRSSDVDQSPIVQKSVGEFMDYAQQKKSSQKGYEKNL